MTLPLIVHQIWVGPNDPPLAMIQSWRDWHPGFEHVLWTDERNPLFDPVRDAMSQHEEFCGVADCMRVCILAKYGGVYVDADTTCLRPIDALMSEEFVVAEHELIRPGVLANSVLGMMPESPIMLDMIDAIRLKPFRPGMMAQDQISGAPGLNMFALGRCRVLPARNFFPVHWTGAPAPGNATIYAKQAWGSTTRLYPDRPGVTDTEECAAMRRNIQLVEGALGIA
jgi:mannosyltransferase OCH1-like enzyme